MIFPLGTPCSATASASDPRACEPRTRRRRDELRRLLGGAAGTTPERGGAMTVRRVSRRPLALLVTPLGRDAGHVEHPRAVKAVFISHPERGIETGEESLRHLYNLTPAEARLVVELLQGKTSEEVAAELAITPHTARSHLKPYSRRPARGGRASWSGCC